MLETRFTGLCNTNYDILNVFINFFKSTLTSVSDRLIQNVFISFDYSSILEMNISIIPISI